MGRLNVSQLLLRANNEENIKRRLLVTLYYTIGLVISMIHMVTEIYIKEYFLIYVFKKTDVILNFYVV